MSKSDLNRERIKGLAGELRTLKQHEVAIALDFDGVCKLFTPFKHQIMFTGLFLHAPAFQRAPFDALRSAYVLINFRSPKTAGKERFLCVHALSEYLVAQGYDCALPGYSKACRAILGEGKKINAQTLEPYADDPEVRELLDWSNEVNANVSKLTEIGLTPGLREHILDPFKGKADFYVVSTATAETLEESMLRDGVDFVLRYIGQETAGKAEALLAMRGAGYDSAVLFGDSVGDQDAAALARDSTSEPDRIVFAAVIPDEEPGSFEQGNAIVQALLDDDTAGAQSEATTLLDRFAGKGVSVDFMSA